MFSRLVKKLLWSLMQKNVLSEFSLKLFIGHFKNSYFFNVYRSILNIHHLSDVLDTWTCQRAADFIRTQPTHVVILWNVPSQHLHPLLVRPHPQGNPTPTQQFNHSTPNQTQHTLNNQPHSPNVSKRQKTASKIIIHCYIFVSLQYFEQE